MRRITAAIAVGLALALLLAACGDGVVDAGPVQAGEPVSDQPGDDEQATDSTDAESPSEQTDPSDADDGPPTGTADSDTGTTGGEATTAVRLYFTAPGGGTPGRADPFLVSVHREIPATPGIALATLRELVDGPSADDEALIDGIWTAVPDDTLVLGVNIDDGLATVDLSREFESGGGSLSMISRLAQVLYTVTQFPTVDEVEFWLDGRPVTVFSGEGIEIDGPASRADLVNLLPTVFVDSPAAGA